MNAVNPAKQFMIKKRSLNLHAVDALKPRSIKSKAEQRFKGPAF